MKTVKFWSIIAGIAFLAAVVFIASCEDPIDEPDNQEIIESEVVDEGVSSNVTTQSISGTTESGNTATGTELSYESWIKVKTKMGPKKAPAYASTRAATGDDGDVITVLLKDVFHNTDTTIYRESLDFSNEYTTSVSYGVKGARRDGYVTITDSVMIYTVSFEDFSFEYELEYEVAVYDDGVTKQTMPYHKIKNLRNNELKVEDLNFSVETGKEGTQSVYFRKKLTHSITVEFNGSDYTLNANVLLKKFVGYHPCVISSTLLDSGISDVREEEHLTAYTSWAKVKHEYSDNRVSTKTYSVNLFGKLEVGMQAAKELDNADVSFTSVLIESTNTELRGVDEYVSRYASDMKLYVNYNLFNLSYPLFEEYAVYDDGVIQFDMPSLRYSEATEEHSVKYFGYYTDDDDGLLYDYYVFSTSLVVNFGTYRHHIDDSFRIIVRRE